MKTIEEKNRLIAEFMGWSSNESRTVYYEPTDKIQGISGFDVANLRFHTSWDWLMPVVVHINATTEYTFVIQAMDCYVYDVNSGNQITQPSMKHQPDELINSVYETLIQFIEWYNENR